MATELDPLTNLPKNRENTRLGEPPTKKSSVHDLARASRDMAKFKGGQGTYVPGTFGSYGPTATVVSNKDFNEQRAQAQSITSLMGKAAVQAAGTIVGMGIEAVGFLGDAPNAISHMISGSELDFERNFISQFGKDIQNYSEDIAPIYATNRVNDGDLSRFFDATYWASNAPSIASTLAFMYPAGMLGKGASLLSRFFVANKTVQRTAGVVGASLGSRHMENMIEAHESFELGYEKAIEEGYSHKEARQIAGEEASFAYRAGYINLASDALQWGMIAKNFDFASRASKKSIADIAGDSPKKGLQQLAKSIRENPNLSIKKAAEKVGYDWRELLSEATLEGMEEFNQEFIQRISEHNTDIALGLSDGKKKGLISAISSPLMREQLLDSGTWDAALMGFIGGAFFKGIGDIQGNRRQRKIATENAQEIAAQQNRIAYGLETTRRINDHLIKGETEKAERLRQDNLFVLAIQGLSKKDAGFSGAVVEGKLGTTIEMFEAIKDMPISDLEALGLSEESREMAEKNISDLKSIGKTLNEFYSSTNINESLDGPLAIMKTEHVWRARNAEKSLSDIGNKIDSILSEGTSGETFNTLSDKQKKVAREYMELRSKQKAIQAFEGTKFEDINVPTYRLQMLKSSKEVALKELKQKEKELVDSLKDTVSPQTLRRLVGKYKEAVVENKELTEAQEKEVQDAVESVTEKELSELLDLLSNEQVTEVLNVIKSLEENNIGGLYDNQAITANEIVVTKENLKSLSDPNMHKEILSAMRLTEEELQVEAGTNFVKSSVEDGQTLVFNKTEEETNRDAAKFKNEQAKLIKERDKALKELTEDSDVTEKDINDKYEEDIKSLNESIGQNFGRIGYIENGITITEVDRFGNSLGEAKKIKSIKSLERVLDAFPVDMDKVFSSEEFEEHLKGYREALKNENFVEAFNFLSDILYRSNFSDFGKSLQNEAIEALKQSTDKITDLDKLHQLFKELYEKLFPSYRNMLLEIKGIFDSRWAEIAKDMEIEVEAVEKTITAKRKEFQKISDSLEKSVKQFENLKKSSESRIEEIFNELVLLEDMGELSNIDRRTKQAREIEELERNLISLEESLKAEKVAVKKQHKEIEKDIKTLEKLKEQVMISDTSDFVEGDIRDMFDSMQRIKISLLEGFGINLDNLKDLDVNYSDMFASLEKAVISIEKFKEYVNTINDASGVIRKATRNAYNELLAEGLLPESSSVFSDLSDKIFDSFRRKFNRNLTEELKKVGRVKQKKKLVQLVNETRLKKKRADGNIGFWAEFDIDFPINSELFDSKEFDSILEAISDLNSYKKMQGKYELYKQVQQNYLYELSRKARSVEGIPIEGYKPPIDHSIAETTEIFAPQRTIFDAFFRLSGNSGTNSDPSSDASQRRYFRFVNNVNTAEHQYFAEFGLAPEEMNIPEYYDREEVIISKITNSKGQYMKEDGTATDTFSIEENIFTTVPLASWEIPGSHDRTFKATEEYLKNNIAGRTNEIREENYKKEKERILAEYKIQRDLWLNDLKEGKDVRIGIAGKSRGIDSQNIESPRPVKDQFNLDEIEFTVFTKSQQEIDGQIINAPRGSVIITDTKRGNIHQGKKRDLNSVEKNTIIMALRSYAQNSTIIKNGVANIKSAQDKASALHDSEGNLLSRSALQVIGDLVYSYGDNRSFIQLDGNNMIVQGVSYQIFAVGSDGKWINKLNPALETAAIKALEHEYVQVQSATTNKKAPEVYNRILYKDGGFTSEQYSNYIEYLYETDAIETFLTEETELENGEPAFISYNQNLILDPEAVNIAPSNLRRKRSGKKERSGKTNSPARESTKRPIIDGDTITDSDQLKDKVSLVRIEDGEFRITYVGGEFSVEVVSVATVSPIEGFASVTEIVKDIQSKENITDKEKNVLIDLNRKIKKIIDFVGAELIKIEKEYTLKPTDTSDPKVLESMDFDTSKSTSLIPTGKVGMERGDTVSNLKQLEGTSTRVNILLSDGVTAEVTVNNSGTSIHLSDLEIEGYTDSHPSSDKFKKAVSSQKSNPKEKTLVNTLTQLESIIDGGGSILVKSSPLKDANNKPNQEVAFTESTESESNKEQKENYPDVRDSSDMHNRDDVEATTDFVPDADVLDSYINSQKEDDPSSWLKDPEEHGRDLENREFEKLSAIMFRATGVPIIVRTKEEGLRLVKMYKPKEKFTLETLPRGMYMGGKAFVFTDGNVNSETLFHEVGHALINQIMEENPELARKLYYDILSSPEGRRIASAIEYGYSEDKNKPRLAVNKDGEYDSFIVGEIITTVLGRDAAGKYDNKSLVRRILSAIENFLRKHFNMPVDMRRLSTDTTISQLADMLVNSTPLRLTPNLIKNTGIQLSRSDFNITGKSVKFTNDSMDVMNYFFFDSLFREHADKVNVIFSPDKKNNFYKEIMHTVFTKIYAEHVMLENQFKGKQKPNSVQQQQNDLMFLINNRNELMDFHMKNLKRYNLEVIDSDSYSATEQIEKDSNKTHQEMSIKLSAKQNATSAVKFLIGSLKSDRYNDTFPSIKKSVDFGKTFNILSNKLAGTTSLQEKWNILAQELMHAEGSAELIRRIFNKPRNLLTKADVTLKLQLNEAFSKNNNKYNIIFSDKGSLFKSIDATINTSSNRTRQQWSTNGHRIKGLFKLGDANREYSLSYLKNKFPSSINDIKLNSSFADRLKKVPVNKRKAFESYFKKMQFLQGIGLNITAYNSLPSSTTLSSMDYIFNMVMEGETTDIFSEQGDNRGNLDAVISHHTENSIDAVENQHQNYDNETIFNVTLNHYVSLIGNKLNNASSKEQFLKDNPHLKDDYSSDSILLSRMDGKGNNLDMAVLSGIRGTEIQESFSKLQNNDKIMVHLNYILQGQYPLFRAGDKSVERFLNLGEFYNSDQINKGAHIPQFMQYLKTELDYIKDNKEHLKNFKGVKDLLDNPIKNSILPMMVSIDPTLIKKMESYVSGKGDALSVTDIKLAEKAIKKHFDSLVQENIEYLEKYLLIEKKGFAYLNNGIADSEGNKKDILTSQELENIINRISVNLTIANIEQTKVFTGHPSFYGKSDNFFHRMSGALGTKKISSVDHLSNEDINEFFPSDKRLYSYTDENGNLTSNFEEGDSVPREYEKGMKPIIRTAVFTDPIVSSRLIAYLKKILNDNEELLKAYKNMEEPDAVGYASMDTYRDLKIRGGEWTEALERLYHWVHRPEGATSIEIENWTTKELETITEKDLINNDGKRTTFNMLKPQYFGPLSEKGFIPGMYKTALLPLLPSYQTNDFNAIRDYMDKSLTGIVTFESANKVGTKGHGEQIYERQKDNTAKINLNGVTTQDTYYEYWGLQLQTGNSVKTSVILGSQFMKQILSNAFEYGDIASDASPELKELTATMTRTHSKLIEIGVEELKTDLGIVKHTTDIGNDLKELQKTFNEYNELLAKDKKKLLNEQEHLLMTVKNYVPNKDKNLTSKLEHIEAEIKEITSDYKRRKTELEESGAYYTVENYDKLMDLLIEESEKRDANNNIIQGLSDIKNLLEVGIGFDILSNKDKLESILTSLADSRTISQNVHGGAKVQAPGTFFNTTDRVYGKDGNLVSNDLEFYEESKVMEVYLPHSYREILEDHPAVTDGRLLKAIGFRIPTSGLNMIENIKIKGFLPQEAGETIVLPSEIVAKAGSDYDVDKLNILLPNYGYYLNKVNYIEVISSEKQLKELIQKELVSEDGKTKRNVKGVARALRSKGYPKVADLVMKEKKSVLMVLSEVDIESLNIKKAYQNQLIETATKILTADSNIKHKLTPVGIQSLENVKDKIEDIKGIVHPSDFVSMVSNFSHISRITQRNMESIAGTGLSALHVSDHIHATRYNYHMSEKFKLRLPHNQFEGKISLAGKTSAPDKLGQSSDIGNILNQIVNMFIDGVKNPISYSLNLNLITAPTAIYLIRAGVPLTHVAYLLNQPIIEDYSRLKSVQKSIQNERRKDSGSRDIKYYTNRSIALELEKKYTDTETIAEFSEKELEDQMTNPDPGIQASYLAEYMAAEQQGQLLNEYVNNTRIDAQSAKNSSELDLKLRSLDLILDGSTTIRNTYKIIMNDMSNEIPGFLEPHYLALKEFRMMFNPFFSYDKGSYEGYMYDNMVNFTHGLSGKLDEKVKLLEKFKSDLITYKLMLSTNMSSEVNRLFIGEHSLPKRVLRAQESSDNILLNELLPILSNTKINGEHYDSLKLVSQKLDVIEQNVLIEAWRDLMETDKVLAEDIAKFTLLQNGLQMNPLTFTKYIPQEIYSKLLETTKNITINEESGRIFFEKFIENNYNEDIFIPTQRGFEPPYKAKIWKSFNKTGATREEIAKGIKREYSPVPTIRIGSEGLNIGSINIFPAVNKSTRRTITPRGFKDYANGRALQSYILEPKIESKEIVELDFNPTNISEARRKEYAEAFTKSYGKVQISEIDVELALRKAKISNNKIASMMKGEDFVGKEYRFTSKDLDVTANLGTFSHRAETPEKNIKSLEEFFGMMYLAEQKFKRTNDTLDNIKDKSRNNTANSYKDLFDC